MCRVRANKDILYEDMVIVEGTEGEVLSDHGDDVPFVRVRFDGDTEDSRAAVREDLDKIPQEPE